MKPENINNNEKHELIGEIFETQAMAAELIKYGIGIENKELIDDLIQKREFTINELAGSLSEQEVNELTRPYLEENDDNIPLDFDSRKKYYAARILIKITESTKAA